jgi:hypothetical protein
MGGEANISTGFGKSIRNRKYNDEKSKNERIKYKGRRDESIGTNKVESEDEVRGVKKCSQGEW